MTYLEVYTDDDGETHFRQVAVDLIEQQFAPPSKPVHVSQEMATTTCRFLEAEPGWDDSYHVTPRRQLAVMLAGELLATCSDGEQVTMKPGDVVLLADETGKGHLSQVRGAERVRFLMIGLAD